MLVISSCKEEKNSNNENYYTCNYYGTINSFSPKKYFSGKNNKYVESDATKAVTAILNEVGLTKNFEIIEDNSIDNAIAIVINKKRYIIYNNNFMNIANDISNNSWSSISILAHEIGHHLQGHTLSNIGSRPPLELEADKFSGFVLAKMGATLEDAQSAILHLVSENPTSTHPGRSERLNAIALGFKDGQASKNKININSVNHKGLSSKADFYNLSKQSKIDFVIQNKIGSDWRLETLGDFITNPYDLQHIKNIRKKDSNFPFTAFGDFDNDGSQDIALKIYKNGNSKLIIYNPQIDKLYWWDEDVNGSVIKRVDSSELESYDGSQPYNMQSDGLMVEYLEVSAYYIFWNGNEFSQIWISD